MKLAQINLVTGQHVPGLGNVKRIDDVEVEMSLGHASTTAPGAAFVGWVPPPGLLVVTPTSKVLIPWERIESVVTEWIPARAEAATALGEKQTGGPASVADLYANSGAARQQSAAAQAPVNLQPGPPPKKGGRR